MTPPKDFTKFLDASGELADDLDLSLQRKLVEDLDELTLSKAARDSYTRDYEAKSGPYRAWLADHPGESIVDGEKDLIATLDNGGTSHVYDLPSAMEARDPALYRRLVELGCLAWDKARIEKAVEDGLLLASDINPWRTTKGLTPKFYAGKRRKQDGAK